MTLAELLGCLGPGVRVEHAGAAPLGHRVTAVTYDSRQVAPGAVFVALRGRHAAGRDYASEAAARGALAVVSEAAPPATVVVPWVRIPDARLALALLADAFHGHPSSQLVVTGITGTNGKTTTSYLLAAIFEEGGLRCGRIGTVSHRIGRIERAAARTTPEAPDLQALLTAMVADGCKACVMEVSSHALALRRVDGIRFAAGVFTNLTRDHLDFHGDMEKYFEAKRRLFELLPPDATAVINADDPRGPLLAKTVTRPVTYAIDHPADVSPGPIAYSLAGLAFDLRTPRGRLRVRSALVGRPNAYNVLAAAATAVALDLPFSAIETGIASLQAVPGRFQLVSGPADEVTVVVDYAHTDDALKNLLETARPLATGRLITIFGCGGDRDRTKRPLMGAVAARLSDLVVVTSDNPRSEDPMRIIEEIARGILPPADRGTPREVRHAAAARATRCLAIADRREAIHRAVTDARPGDLILIAGKGHETYQVIGDKVLPFDDVEVARTALARRRSNSQVS
jgi:UDP-N-acetylmuramoyl-L-alanyl-D-glutamate--2,6-diaminopimelate ligase